MRRLIAILTLVLFSVTAYADIPWLCETQGKHLNYVRRYADSGKVKWRYSIFFRSVGEEGPDGRRVDYTYDFRKPGGSQMYGGPIRLNALLSPGGDVTLDIAATLQATFRNMFPKAKIVAEGGTTVLPSELTEGDTLPDVSAVITVHGVKYAVSVSERKVLRRETIETAAGSFDCTVVSEHKIESGLGLNRDVVTHTWYARGIGEVRHDTYDWKSGKLQTVETLESVE